MTRTITLGCGLTLMVAGLVCLDTSCKGVAAERVDEGATPEAMRLALYDPQTSGGLLIAIPPRRHGPLLAALRRRRVWMAEVGEVVKQGPRAVELHYEEDGG